MNEDRPSPLVSAVIPVFNGERFIGQAIESALAQTYPKIEVIVSDDGSTDATREVVARCGSRVTYLRQANAGIGAARNRGIREAHGTLIAFLDHDDIWRPEKIERQIASFESVKDCAVLFSDYFLMDPDGKTIRADSGNAERIARMPGARSLPDTFVFAEPFLDSLLEYNVILPSTVLARRDCILRVGGFGENREMSEDSDLWFRMAAQEFRFAFVESVLAAYRVHPTQITRNAEGRYRRQINLLARMLSEPSWKPGLRRKIKRKLSGRHFLLGHQQAQKGFIREAAQSYRAATRLRPRPKNIALLIAAAGAVLCPPLGKSVLKGLLRITGASKALRQRD